MTLTPGVAEKVAAHVVAARAFLVGDTCRRGVRDWKKVNNLEHKNKNPKKHKLWNFAANLDQIIFASKID